MAADEYPPAHHAHGRMQRMPSEWYRGHAFVHWSMTIEGRRTGWLNPDFHRSFRELQLHTLSRYRLLCMVYCLMPDHLHLLWAGLSSASDQDKGAAFLRTYVTREWGQGAVAFQKQPWDVILRGPDREREAVARTAFYIAENPVRAGLAVKADQWAYSGAQAAGYPDLDWRQPDFPERIWAIYEEEARRLE
jgi:putative transposase